MKKYGVRAVLTFSLFFVLAGLGQAAQLVDRIVAVVNGEIITFQDLQQQIRLSVGQTPDSATAEKIAPQVLDGMIDDVVPRSALRGRIATVLGYLMSSGDGREVSS